MLSVFIFTACFFLACEEKHSIRISGPEFSPQLAVTATLETDSGRFYVLLGRTYPLPDKLNHRNDDPEWRRGIISLYEDGLPVLQFTGDFELARDDGDNTFFRKGLPLKAGSLYRLEVSVDGYDPVWAEAVMPDAPVIRSIRADTTVKVTKQQVRNFSTIGQYNSYGNSGRIYPLKVVMEDNSPSVDYYMMRINMSYDAEGYPDKSRYGLLNSVGTDQMDLIRNTPEIEEMEDVFENKVYDAYFFETMLISDYLFAGHTGNLDLYGRVEKYNQLENYTGRELVFGYRYDLLVSHITQESFSFYRGIILQWKQDFFHSEPVVTPSNIHNGYGCFSLSNSVRHTLLEYRSYYYPDMWPPVGQPPTSFTLKQVADTQ